MKYYTASNNDTEDWIEMAQLLWPHISPADAEKDWERTRNSEKEEVFICRNDSGKAIGFIEVSIRSEYIPGAETDRVGYVEGIYVKPEYRHKGIAAKLLKKGEEWALKRGCVEMGSDTWLSNTGSREFHRKTGFEEAEILVHFIKKINL